MQWSNEMELKTKRWGVVWWSENNQYEIEQSTKNRNIRFGTTAKGHERGER